MTVNTPAAGPLSTRYTHDDKLQQDTYGSSTKGASLFIRRVQDRWQDPGPHVQRRTWYTTTWVHQRPVQLTQENPEPVNVNNSSNKNNDMWQNIRCQSCNESVESSASQQNGSRRHKYLLKSHFSYSKLCFSFPLWSLLYRYLSCNCIFHWYDVI